jgi:hypothetical protein
MNPKILVRALVILMVSAALTGAPEISLAQRGGHGSGGSFHGGGFHGGGGGNFRGPAGFAGYHTGFGGAYGYRGFYGHGGHNFYGYGGYPSYFGINFGFGSYWGGYPYWYGYGPWWGPSGYYPSYPYSYYPYGAPPPDQRDHGCNPDYRDPNHGCTGNSSPSSDGASPSSETFGHESSLDSNYVTTNFADYRTDAHTSRMRPAVRNAIEAMRAMPPDARDRQLNSGRYDDFSPEERELLRSASQSLSGVRGHGVRHSGGQLTLTGVNTH